MARSSKIFRALAILFVWVLTVATSQAQTNATEKWLSHQPLTAVPQAPPAPSEDAASGDAEKFFEKYKEAATLLAKNKRQDAAITMDLLSRNLSTSPWLEIALLKHAQIVELTNDRVAEQDYTTLRERLENAPYFKSNADRAKLFGGALQGSVDSGINRIRLNRVRDALTRYHGRYAEYPESLAKLAILNYTDMENIHSVNNQLFRYVPQSPRVNPFISFQRFELESIDSEPFVVNTPQLEGISQLSEKPLKYTALIHIPGKSEPARVVEDQTVQGFFVAAITHDGAIVSTANRTLVLTAP